MVGQELSTSAPSKILRAFSTLDSQKEEVKMPRPLTYNNDDLLADSISLQHQVVRNSLMPYEQGPSHMTPNHFYPNPRPSIGGKESFVESSSDIFHTRDAKGLNTKAQQKKSRYATKFESFEHLSATCLSSEDNDDSIQP